MVKLAFFFASWVSVAVDSCLRFLSELVPVKIRGGLDANKPAEPVGKASLAWEVLGCESFVRYCLAIISADSASGVFAMYGKSDQYVSSKS